MTKQLHDLGAIRVASWFLCGFVRQKDFVPQKKDSRELRTLLLHCQTFAPALPSAVSPEQTGFLRLQHTIAGRNQATMQQLFIASHFVRDINLEPRWEPPIHFAFFKPQEGPCAHLDENNGAWKETALHYTMGERCNNLICMASTLIQE